MKPIKTVLNTYLFKTGLDAGVNQQQALRIWPKVVGKKIAEKLEIPNMLYAKAMHQKGRGGLAKSGDPASVITHRFPDSYISLAFCA